MTRQILIVVVLFLLTLYPLPAENLNQDVLSTPAVQNGLKSEKAVGTEYLQHGHESVGCLFFILCERLDTIAIDLRVGGAVRLALVHPQKIGIECITICLGMV